MDPVENIGATLIKEAARNTVREAGDGTTTATVIADALLRNTIKNNDKTTIREIKEGIFNGSEKVRKLLDKASIEVTGDMLRQVANISCNNDVYLGEKIGEAFEVVGKDGVVLMEESETNETTVEFVNGAQFDSPLKSAHLVTDKDKGIAVLENPAVLIVSSPIPNIRKIQNILEHVIKGKKSLLIVADVDQQPFSALLANKVKGNIKVNIVDLPGFGPSRQEAIEDLALLTGATVMNEELGDDMDLVDVSILGSAVKAVTDSKSTVLQVDNEELDLEDRLATIRLSIKDETNPFFKKKLEQRLAMLTGTVAIIKVGGDSKIELKEKKDRVEDAIYATKAALQEGIIAGGGVALYNIANKLKPKDKGEEILFEAIKSPFYTILENAGINTLPAGMRKNDGINVITGKKVHMIKAGIIDPVLVTKSALKNAVSVVNTIISADCVISNKRMI